MKTLFLAAFTKQHRVLLWTTVIFICLLAVASQLEIMAIGIITQQQSFVGKPNNIIGQVLSGLNRVLNVTENVTHLAIFLVCVALFKAAVLFVQRYSTKLLAIRISSDLRLQYFEHIQTLPLSFFQKHDIGTLSSRVIGDAALIAEAVNACLFNYIQTPVVVLTTLTICFMISWQLSLIVFFGFPVILFPIIFLAKRVKRISKQIQHNQERFASALIDFLSGIQTVKVFAMELFSFKKYRERNAAMTRLEEKNARYDLSTRPIVHTLGMAFLAVTLIYGLYGLQMGVAEVLVYCGLLYLFYEPIKKFAEENTHIQRGVAAAERIYEMMGVPEENAASTTTVPLQGFNQTIECEDLWFKYEDEWVVKGVSFSIKKGEKIAIVGPTGSGKSTLAQLFPRLYDVQKGQIRIDGKPIDCFTKKSLRELIAYVPQKPFLFLDTVSENIAFGRNFSPDEIQQAAQKAYADEFIVKLPSGYHTEVAEGGKNLSGGQQQRLAIARALVKKAPILIMDEATSSLDAVSERSIKMAMQELRGHVTQIIIAHRLSTIEDADKIIYLDHGEKVAEGTQEELLKSCPGFRLMWELLHQKDG